jgi:molybdate transport system permease protein
MGRVLLAACLVVVVAFLVIPLVALIAEAPLSDLPHLLADDQVGDALKVTARTTIVAYVLFVALGTPAAWVLATKRFPGRGVVVTLIELPLVLPPAVAGVALLAAFGSSGMLGGSLMLPFTEWAVVVAVAFVASPFYLRQAIAAFEAVDPAQLEVARTLGASPLRTFWRVGLPLAAGSLVAGWVLAFARGIGEFGATIIFAGSVRGETQTLTLAVYELFETSFDTAVAIGVLLVSLSAAVLISYKVVSTWRSSSTSRAGSATSLSTSP